MRFVLDENILGHTEGFLRASGYEVNRPPRRTKDRAVLAFAQERRSILVTRDRDFLNFIPGTFSGIIYLQIHPSIAEHITQAIENLLNHLTERELQGKVTILHTAGYEILP